MNLFESLVAAVQKPETPPHIGEAMLMWTYNAALEAVRGNTTLMINHTDNLDLKQHMEHLANDVLEPQLKTLSAVMREEGLTFPPRTPEQAKADEAGIPPGAKMSDEMIANRLVADLEGLLITAHGVLVQGLRDDLLSMFYRFHTQLLAQSFNLKKTMQKVGWLRIPPYYRAPGAIGNH